MRRIGYRLANPVLVAGFVLSGAAQADETIVRTARVGALVPGLICASDLRTRHPAPDTIAGWVYEPLAPIELIAEGQVVPAVIGVGFGVRYTLTDSAAVAVRYSVTHPPMPPGDVTVESWDASLAADQAGTVFFQFEVAYELQPGDWSIAASVEGEEVFRVGFAVRPASDLPALAGVCQGALLSFSQGNRGAAG